MSQLRTPIDDAPEVVALHGALRRELPHFEELLAEVNGHSCYEDGVYRFYHRSFKVYHRLHPQTHRVVQALRALAPDRPLHPDFEAILLRGGSSIDVVTDDETGRADNARFVVEAFLHAKYFLEMAVKYGRELEAPPRVMPSGWAALLELFGLR